MVEVGVVAIAGRASGLAAPRYIRRNAQFVAAATGPRKAMLDSADVERRIAWRKGLLVFNGQRLGAAAAEVNRSSDLSVTRSAEPTSELQSLMRISHAVICLK